jgi:hypothetical protein
MKRRSIHLLALPLIAVGFGSFSVICQQLTQREPARIVITSPAACFKDQGTALGPYSSVPASLSGRDLNGYVFSSLKMTNGLCATECSARAFPFSGTQSGTFCFCGNTPPGQYGASTACTDPCLGDPTHVESCGGALANHVSVTPRTPMAPANGGQCVMTISGTVPIAGGSEAYTHTESQTWDVQGPGTVDSSGRTIYKVNWTVHGAGFALATTASGNHSQVTRRVWTITVSNQALTFYRKIIAGGTMLQFVDVNGTATAMNARTETQSMWIDGVQQGMPNTTLGNWVEYQDTLTTSNPPVNPVSGAHSTPTSTYGYAKPGGVSGTISCAWNVTL